MNGVMHISSNQEIIKILVWAVFKKMFTLEFQF